MNERIKRNAPAQVEQTLANYGAWDAVSFLLITHRLRQTGYEAWRMGEVACLDEVITGNPARALEMLEAALQHAESMGLINTPMSWSGWGKQSGQTLRLFHDDGLNTRFQRRLSPDTDRTQLDLFMDAPHIVLLNRLRQAMLNRSPECDTLFDRALDDMVNEAALARLDTIRAAMMTTAIDNPVDWLIYLNDVIAPAVDDEFPHRSMDLMAPLWRTAADAMLPAPFDPERPEHHASHAYLLAHAWEQCIRSTEQVDHWFQYAALHDRRIAALSAMHEHATTRAAWMLYCWLCPEPASTALAKADLHACGLHGLWQQFSQVEPEQGIETFPALIALQYRPDHTQPASFAHARHTQGWQAYRQLTDLLASEQQHGGADIERRSALKATHPWLFQAFMASRH